MTKKMALFIAVLLITVFTFVGSNGNVLADDEKYNMEGDVPAAVMALQGKVAELEQRLGIQEDIKDIEILMYSYLYYIDRMLFSQVIPLFADSAISVEIGGKGVYLGKEGITRFFMNVMAPVTGADEDKMHFGLFMEHNICKPVIHVAPDRQTAKGRFYYFGFFGHFPGAFPPMPSSMQMGIYSNEFVKEDGVWKISKFWLPFTTTGYNFTTWASDPTGITSCGGEANPIYPPDLPTTWYHPYPEIGVVPFHYPNPVTGEPIPDYVDPTHHWSGNWPDDCENSTDTIKKGLVH